VPAAPRVEDIVAVMDAAGIDRAHVVACPWAGSPCSISASITPRARSIVVAGAGYGAEKQFEGYFREVSNEVARQFETQGSETAKRIRSAPPGCSSRTRIRAAGRSSPQLGEHSAVGAANTMRGCKRVALDL
jgi:hypothetical protein